MITLSINTSTKITHLALHDGAKILSSFAENLGREQSSLLQGKIATLLEQANLEKSDIELIAVTRGPGFYTGIRCGLSFALGLAYSLGLPVLALSSLDLLQEAALTNENFASKRFVIPYIKSKKNSVFSQIYDRENGEFVAPPACYNLDFLLDFARQKKDTIFVSYDTELYPDLAPLTFTPALDIANCFASLEEKEKSQLASPLEVKAVYFREPDIG